MNIERIREIQQETAYPDSISVQQALLKVWNECKQEKKKEKDKPKKPIPPKGTYWNYQPIIDRTTTPPKG
ncbi:hypothetical protein [Marinilabilia salmonicolor]|uniref:Uncharacterized protein n=1 Tax=Marinilabilia salmonicolor TaxID=989 RepID=A0A368VC21_9BACT|nr:hypothetical protein [Marinilabilia salmonicolor]RCW38676.1 hypothetical protein DFO77_103146 [Marinilabilia salmonicolor]